MMDIRHIYQLYGGMNLMYYVNQNVKNLKGFLIKIVEKNI